MFFFGQATKKTREIGKVRFKSSLMTKTATSQEWEDWHGHGTNLRHNLRGLATKNTPLP